MKDLPLSQDIAARLEAAAGYVFDLDGTLVLGDRHNEGITALPGGPELLATLDRRGVPYRILTNGTVKTPNKIAAALAAAGLDIPADRIMTPSTVAGSYFASRGFEKILVLGVEGVYRPIEAAGLRVVRPLQDEDTEDADAVFIGWYRQIHMDEVEAACRAVWNGARICVASMVPFFTTRSGRALGSSRPIAAMITSVTGKRAMVLGKPSPHAMREAARQMGGNPAEMVVVGDDPALEVRMAREASAVAVGVHTGIAGEADFAALAPGSRPHLSLPGISALANLVAGLPGP
jgi:4-nitrophenyl phosphatase